MKILRNSFIALLFCTSPILAAPCGGSFTSFVAGLKQEARAKGHSSARVNQFFANVAQDPKVIKADRAQGVFQLPFLEFSSRLISQHRMDHGKKNARKYAAIFDQAEREFGISRGVILAFWAFETDFGAVQGNFNTLNALVTLAHDCRRPELFRPQVFAALELFERNNFDPNTTKGAWAGEIGMVQMLPEDILVNGIDGDGDGKVSLKTSAPDALLSGANMLRALGWRSNEPWLEEVIIPSDFDWSLTGFGTEKSARDWERIGVQARDGGFERRDLQASVLLPQGRFGPAFIVYPNFHVLFEWNKSFVYVTTAAYFATRLEGAPRYYAPNDVPAMDGKTMKVLQQKLVALGYDVGKIDGILGAKTRKAVQDVQKRLGLPADAWPTRDLLSRL